MNSLIRNQLTQGTRGRVPFGKGGLIVYHTMTSLTAVFGQQSPVEVWCD